MPPLGITNIVKAPPTKALAWSRLRGPIASVGTGVCKYADTYGPAMPSGVRGFVGPPAASVQRPTTWYVRITGSNDNGGTSTSVERSGSDAVTNGTTTITSATAAFTSADVGKGICINSGANARRHKIISVIDAQTIIVDRVSSNASGLAWVIGGAWADIRPVGGHATITADTNSAVLSGDTVYVGAGTYRAIIWNAATTWTPAFNGVVNIVGDVYGQYTGDAGMVQFTAYVTNDKTSPSGTAVISLNNKSNITFSNIFWVAGSNIIVTATAASNSLASQNISFVDCAFLQMNASGAIGVSVGNVLTARETPLNWLIDRCHFMGGGSAGVPQIQFTAPTLNGPDYSITSVIRNCVMFGSVTSQIVFTPSGALTGLPGGLVLRNLSLLVGGGSGGSGFQINAAGASTALPCSVYNCLIYAQAGTALNANQANTIIEDYNNLYASTPRTNVSTGIHSIANGSYAPLFHFGQERIWGGLIRPLMEPMSGSPLLGFSNDSGSSRYDLMNRPRPAGGGALPYPAVGALERGSTPTQATSPAPPTGTYDWQFTGPGYQEFLLPVDTTASVISISVQRDSAYSPPPGATLPAMQILANARIGIPAQTIVDTGSSGGWNTLTAASFTPTGTGWVTVRIVSYDGTGVSVVSFANLTVT